MQILKSLVISNLLLSSFACLNAMQSKNYNKFDNNFINTTQNYSDYNNNINTIQTNQYNVENNNINTAHNNHQNNSINNINQQFHNNFNNYNSINNLSNEMALHIGLSNALGQNFNMYNTVPLKSEYYQFDNKKNYNELMDYKFTGLWEEPEIKSLNKNLEFKLETRTFNEILNEYNNKILSFITSNNIKDCSKTDLSDKAIKKYLKHVIKEQIISPKNSIEEQLKTLIFDINKENEDVIFDIIVEDFSDKYIKNHPIKLSRLFDSKTPGGTVLHVVQDYHSVIYEQLHVIFEKLRLALASLDEFEYFETKFNKNKKHYEEVICHNIINKLETAFQTHFVGFVECYGWEEALEKYSRPKSYIKKHLMPQIFEDEIIKNNISVYTLSRDGFYDKYNNNQLQNMWQESIDGELITICDQHIYGKDSISEMADQFLDPAMQDYATKKYTEFLENSIKREIENKTPLNTILNKYNNDATKAFADIIYHDLTQEKPNTLNNNSNIQTNSNNNQLKLNHFNDKGK